MVVRVWCDVPSVRVVSEANSREHWAARHRRHKAQRFAVLAVLGPRSRRPPLPCVVTLTRKGPRKLDTDNLAGGFKAVRDAVAEWLGVDDSPDAPVEWRYEQAKGSYGFSINIVSC